MAETGHIKNIENFEVIISACNGYGSAYNPNNSALAISAFACLQKESKVSH